MKDCHVHSDYTDRSNDSLENYVAGAKAKGIDELTITELVEIIDGAPPFAFPFYKLKVKRTGDNLGFKLNLGLEIGLQPGIEDKIVRAFYGTTKYCNYFLNSTTCPNRNKCIFLHKLVTDEDIINDARQIVQQVYPNTVKSEFDNSHTRQIEHVDLSEIGNHRSFSELISDVYMQMDGSAISDEEMEIMRRAAKEAGVIDETG